jgi:hypothetical protein
VHLVAEPVLRLFDHALDVGEKNLAVELREDGDEILAHGPYPTPPGKVAIH